MQNGQRFGFDKEYKKHIKFSRGKERINYEEDLKQGA